MSVISRTITTLNIEASSARFISVVGRRIERWGTILLSPGLVRDTLVADPAALGSALDDLFRSARVSKNGVVVSITGLRSVSRMVTLPKMRTSQMNEAVRWAARREMPVPLDDLHLSWQVIGTTGAEQSVFLLGTPRSLLDTVFRALKIGGIKPGAVDLKPLALARMVSRAEAIIIDLEGESTSIILLVDGIPEVMHTIIVRQEGLLAEDRAQKLTEDLSRTLRFYNNAHPDRPLGPATPAFLTGELASYPSVVELVQKSIGYPIETAAAYVQYSADLPVPQYAVNIGLALREMPAGRGNRMSPGRLQAIKVNVLPPEYRS